MQDRLAAALGDAYRIERELGGGGMSRVFLVENRELGRQEVVKVLPPELTTDLSVVRFRQEIGIAARLEHPNIVPVFGAGTGDDIAYYAMPFVDGESLRQRLTRHATDAPNTPLPLDEVIRILRDVIRAIAYAHRKDVVHRDIKPENVLLSDDGVRVTDFGIAKAVRVAGGGMTGTLTASGTSIGTPAYMAPEQAVGDPATDHRADLYAFGAMAYELLSGAPPFAGRTPSETIAAHALVPPKPIAELRADTPAPVAEMVMRCLAKQPEGRPADADEVKHVLDSSGTGASITAPPRRRFQHRRAWTIAAIVAVVLVVAAAVRVASIPREQWAVLVTWVGTKPPPLRVDRYVVTPFVSPTHDVALEEIGQLTADQITQALHDNVPGIQVMDDRDKIPAELLLNKIPGRSGPTDLARELAAGILITGSIYVVGDSLHAQAKMRSLVTGVMSQRVENVSAAKGDHTSIIRQLQDRLVGVALQISDSTIVNVPGAYSDPPSPQAYTELRRGIRGYFTADPTFYQHIRNAEKLDATYVTPTVFLGYLDAWYQRDDSLAHDLERETRLERRMTRAERAMADYARALTTRNLDGLLDAAQRFMEATPYSDSPLLVSSTALGLRRLDVADSALRGVDPKRGFALISPYYWQSRIGLAQARGEAGKILADAREAAHRFPTAILFRIYEVRQLAIERNLDAVRRSINDAELYGGTAEQARVVVAAHAATALLMSGDSADASRLAREWWPAASTMIADSTRWVQEAVADLALLSERWDALQSIPPRGSGHFYTDRLSYAAVGALHRSDTAAVTKAERAIAAGHPVLDHGYRELQLARIAAHRGDKDRAVKLLTQAVDEGIRLHLFWGIDFLSDPFLAPLLGDPHFEDMLPTHRRNQPSGAGHFD